MEYSLIEVCQIRSWKHFCCAETFGSKWEIPNKYLPHEGMERTDEQTKEQRG